METAINIAVIGGTGKAGTILINRLLEKKYRVKALVRNPEKLKTEDSLLELVQGDVRNYESVYELVKDCKVVISTLGQSKGDDPVFCLAANNIIKAMNELNIKRYIMLTGLSIDVAGDKKSFRRKTLSKMMKLSFPKVIADKQKEYEILAQSNLDWTVVRIPLLELAESKGQIKASLADCPGGIIFAVDLADFLINQILDCQYIRCAPFIAD